MLKQELKKLELKKLQLKLFHISINLMLLTLKNHMFFIKYLKALTNKLILLKE